MSASQIALDFAEGQRRKAVGQARSASKHAGQIAALVPIALELARKAGRLGIIAADVRLTAVQRGILTGQETGRDLSYLPHVMRTAGLVSTGKRRNSHIPQSNHNSHLVYVAPEYAEAAA